MGGESAAIGSPAGSRAGSNLVPRAHWRAARPKPKPGSSTTSTRSRWQREKGTVERLRQLRGRVEQTKLEIEQAERQYDLNRAAELKYGTLASLEKQLNEESGKFAEPQAQSRLIKEEVDEEDIAEVVSRWTGVPVTRLLTTSAI